MIFRAGCCALVLLVAAVTIAADDYKPLALAQVPKVVRDAVMKKYPDAKPQDAHQGIDGNKKTFFDVHVLVKDQKIWITCDPAGVILTIDREIKPSQLPKPVTAALAKKYPQAAIRLVNEITDDSAPVYEIAFTVGKKNLIATFAASGELLEEGEDEP